jgi:NTP pyrophosphatase (non-canonical NTP hydrolase)
MIEYNFLARMDMGSQVYELLEEILCFCDVRDWRQFHTPRNLATSISIEAAELLELFQWQIGDNELDPSIADMASEEIADIFIYLLLISNELGIDLIEAAKLKIEKNRKKYPVDKVKGRAIKYSEL